MNGGERLRDAWATGDSNGCMWWVGVFAWFGGACMWLGYYLFGSELTGCTTTGIDGSPETIGQTSWSWWPMGWTCTLRGGVVLHAPTPLPFMFTVLLIVSLIVLIATGHIDPRRPAERKPTP